MTQTTNIVPPLRGDETQLYETHAALLLASLRKAVSASDAIIEDACQHAWIQLLRFQPDRDHVFGWLRLTALRDAWALCGRESRCLSLDVSLSDHQQLGTLADTIPGRDLEIELDARDALRAVGALRPKQRYALSRAVAGLSYEEIQAEGGLTFRQVDRHLRKARAALHA